MKKTNMNDNSNAEEFCALVDEIVSKVMRG